MAFKNWAAYFTAGVLVLSGFSFAEDMKEEKDKGEQHDKHDHDHDDDESKSEEIKVGDLPAKVSSAFAKDFPGAKIEEVGKETYKDGTIHYEIEFTDKAGEEHEIEYNVEGEKLDDHD